MDLDKGYTKLILEEAENEGLSLEQKAYVLATTYHETNKTMEPVREAYWLSENWRRRNLRYYPWYGRGFVQITWRDNYVRAGKKLGVDLTTDPDKVMEPDISAKILVKGMKEGWFTGKKLDDYINDQGTDYVNARRIVNGLDRASDISELAMSYERVLAKEVSTQEEQNMSVPTGDTTKDLIMTHQKRLADLGYYRLRVDGLMGPGTEEALSRFKDVHGLRERPFPGPMTCTLLWGKDATAWEMVEPEGETGDDPEILTEARRHLGVREYRGSANNPVIMGWADDLDQWYPGDDVPWCGLFVAICAARGAPNEPQNFNRLGARQWLNWGVPADERQIPLGSVVVLWRTARNHWHGHVGICTGQNENYVRLIGGNQSNEVNEKWFNRNRILGVRVPRDSRYPTAPRAATGALSTNEA